MYRKIPPPVFKYDIEDIDELYSKISVFPDFKDIPRIELKRVVTGSNAITELSHALDYLGIKKEQPLFLVMDKVPMFRAGEEIKAGIQQRLTKQGYLVETIVLPADEYGLVHPDYESIEHILPRLTADCGVISVGSGVVTDVAKHACYVWEQENLEGEHLPLVSCMTANTVPAYASRSSIISKDGVKRTWPSRTPDIIIMDYQILADCPYNYTVGGVGDLFPVFCSYADWFLADVVGLGSFFDPSWRIMDDPKELLIPYSRLIADQELLAMEVQGKCLTHCGLAMTFARDSVPVSGLEHVMSHLMDMSAPADERKVGVHGQQVGVACLWSIVQFEKIIDYLDEHAKVIKLDDCFPNPSEVEAQTKAVFLEIDPSGAMGEECWHDVSIKLEMWASARDQINGFLKNWTEHRAALKELLPYSAQACARALSLSKHPLRSEDMEVPINEARMRWSFRNARLMRKRFTSSDLAAFLKMYDEEWEDDVVRRVRSLTEMV